MTIAEWQQLYGDNENNKGFYEYENDLKAVEALLVNGLGETLTPLGEALKRIITGYRNLTDDRSLLLSAGELVEAQNELRAGHKATEIYFVNQKPEGFPIELADAVIRIMGIAQKHGIDLEAAMTLKHEYNLTRPYKHGKVF